MKAVTCEVSRPMIPIFKSSALSWVGSMVATSKVRGSVRREIMIKKERGSLAKFVAGWRLEANENRSIGNRKEIGWSGVLGLVRVGRISVNSEDRPLRFEIARGRGKRQGVESGRLPWMFYETTSLFVVLQSDVFVAGYGVAAQPRMGPTRE